LFSAISTVHCTTLTKEAEDIRITLVQKTTYIIKLLTIINNPTYKVEKAFLKTKKSITRRKTVIND
jgi:hypothetical protein